MATVIGGPLAEELGWRGFAQPQLANIIGLGKSGWIIGLIWSFWHLPLFYFFPKVVAGIPIGYCPLILTSFSIFFSWPSHHTKAGVLLAVLLHTGMNFALGIFNTVNAEENNGLLLIFTLISVVTALLFGAKLWDVKPEGFLDKPE